TVPHAKSASRREPARRDPHGLHQHPGDHPRQVEAPAPEPAQDKYADEIIDAVLRATLHGRDLTGHLLSFSRHRLLNPQPVDVNALVDSSVKLLGRTLGATIRIVTETREDAGVAFVDPASLEAAILNVALNARDAMPHAGTRADLTPSVRTRSDT